MSEYGCKDRAPYKPAQLLHDHHGRLVASIPHVMTKDCVYTTSALGQADKRCDGCKWRKEAQ